MIARHGGRVVKSAGDGVMASFGSASDGRARGHRAAGAASPSTSRSSPSGWESPPATWRGTATTASGCPVVVAARLQAAADGGQILVSHIVRLLAGDRAGDRYEPLGALELKGLPEPVEALRGRVGPAPSDRRRAAPVDPTAAAARPRRSPRRIPFVGRDDAAGRPFVRAWHDAQHGPGASC